MAQETTPLLDDTDGQLYEEDDLSIYSENTKRRRKLQVKLLYILAMLIVIPLCWYTLFYLPNSVPPAVDVPLDIQKVNSVPVYLRPLELKANTLMGEFDIDNYRYTKNTKHKKHEKEARRRIILVGDVHGSYKPLVKLMKKMKVNHKKDFVMFLGDFISKGPDSSAVLNWAIANDVGCILGNHEIYIMNRYAQFHSLRKPEFLSDSKLIENDFTTKEFYDLDDEMKIAKHLTPEQAGYLLQCSLISQLGPVAHMNKRQTRYKDDSPTEGIAVHAGLMWNVEQLDDQDPETVVSIRSLLLPNFTVPTDDPHIDGAESWSKHWNKYQRSLTLNESQSYQKVFYGHNARKGLDMNQFTMGLDTGCVTGGELTAVELWAELNKNGDTVYREKVHQVSCDI